MTELDLDRQLRELGDAVPAPPVPLEEDLARGRRRLRVHRALALGGVVAGVAVVALAVPLVGDSVAGDSGTGPASAPTVPASKPPASAPTPHQRASHPASVEDPRTGAQLVRDYRDVLAEHLDPDGTHLQKRPDNLQSGGGLGTKLGWTEPGQEGLGMVQVFVGPGWNSFLGADCGSRGACRKRTVDGIEATVIEWNGATTVLVHGDDGPVAITVDSLFGNNSLVPAEGMDIPLADLVRAAADDRLTPPTPEQVAGAGAGMGFPDPGAPPGTGASPSPTS